MLCRLLLKTRQEKTACTYKPDVRLAFPIREGRRLRFPIFFDFFLQDINDKSCVTASKYRLQIIKKSTVFWVFVTRHLACTHPLDISIWLCHHLEEGQAERENDKDHVRCAVGLTIDSSWRRANYASRPQEDPKDKRLQRGFMSQGWRAARLLKNTPVILKGGCFSHPRMARTTLKSSGKPSKMQSTLLHLNTSD